MRKLALALGLLALSLIYQPSEAKAQQSVRWQCTPTSSCFVNATTPLPVTSGGGGGGGAVTAALGSFVDGAITTMGLKTDATWDGVSNASEISILRYIGIGVNSPIPAGTNVIGHVIADTGSTTAVTALPAIPTGSNVIGHVIADSGSTTVVSALPSGSVAAAATGTAGSAGTAVTTVQGIASMTPILTSATPTSQYPLGATAETISATGTTAATTATLATTSGKTTYICGFSIRANATAAATGNATVTGTITGTLNFTQWTAPNSSGLGVNEQVFMPCVPASATNTTIGVVSAAPGTGGVVSVSAWGYLL